jgi:hypothetical protein
MKSQGGFTLIEALVAGTISVIIPAVVITLLRVNNTELASNTNALRMTQIADLVSDDIHRTAFAAAYAYSDGEFTGAGCPAAAPDPGQRTDLHGVIFCDADKALIKGYRIVRTSGSSANGRLEERIGSAGAWKPFTVGEDTVKVEWDPWSYLQKAGGLFGVYSAGEFMWFNFRYNMKIGGVAATLPTQTESFVCRNHPW